MTTGTARAAEPGAVSDRTALEAKRASLIERLSSLDSLVIAYSGGVDSGCSGGVKRCCGGGGGGGGSGARGSGGSG